MQRGLLQQRIEDVRLVVRGVQEIPEAEFDAHVAEALRMADEVRAVLVVVEAGGRISPAYRAKLVRVGLLQRPHAILADGLLARAEIISLDRIGANVGLFATSELDQAFEALAIPARLRAPIRDQVAKMRRQLAETPVIGMEPAAPSA